MKAVTEHTTEPLPWQHILHREISLIPSNASAGAWEEAVRLYTEAESDLSPLITATFDARSQAEVNEALRLTASGDRQLIKAVLRWENT